MCSSGVGFNPVVDDTRYTFDVFGIYNGLFTMKDRQTGSVWTHFDGSVLSGPLANSGARLEIAPMLTTTWAEWQELHPDTMVLDWYEQYADNYANMNRRFGKGQLGPNFQESLLNHDSRLPVNELVFGVNVGEAFKAYPLADFPSSAMVNDNLGGVDIVVFLDGSKTSAAAYLATIDGDVRTFSVEGGQITDDLGTVWDFSGRAVSGPLAGRRLTYVPAFVTEWYGWSAYHPGTSIYGE